MATLSTVSLAKPTTSDTVAAFLAAENANMAKLEQCVPNAVAQGSNNGLYYRLYPDGTVDIWGNTVIAAASCKVGAAGQYTSGYISPVFEIKWPVTLVGEVPSYSLGCMTSIYPDVFIMPVEVTLESFKGRFYAQFDESANPWGLGFSTKTVSIDATGRWK